MKLIRFAIAFLFCGASLYTHAQGITGIQDINAFSDLNEKRIRLNAEIRDLESQRTNIYIADSTSISRDIEYGTQSLKTLTHRKEKMADGSPSADSIEQSIDYYTTKLETFKRELQNSVYQSTKKKEREEQIELKKSELSKTENSINQLMIPKISQQNFMFYSSIAFVILMSIILSTFFFVVWRDEHIRRSIFSSDSGIQFIALFSIIIAIIIFGLTGVLEGKELSALLGSVAGYILGKAKFSGENGKASANTSVQQSLPISNLNTEQPNEKT